MSDTESNTAPAHVTLGGKSLASIERPRYKSWRKKFRKMHAKFDGVLDENKRFFKEEQKLEGIARRLREELDGLMELCLDINENPALPPELRFDISLERESTTMAAIPSVVDENITTEGANLLFKDYNRAVHQNAIPHLDLHVIRRQIDKRLSAQDVIKLETLASEVPHAIPSDGGSASLPEELRGDEPPGFLTTDQEDIFLTRSDTGTGNDPLRTTNTHLPPPITASSTSSKLKDGIVEEKHWAELTAREAERQVELQNPQSQHNWLKLHAKQGGAVIAAVGVDADDSESLPGGSHDSPSRASASTPSGKGAAKRNLARQVGDRALERAREEASPGSFSTGIGGDDDEVSLVDEQLGASTNGGAGSSRKRGRGDVDGTYRVKGGKGAGTSGRGKRKRTTAGGDENGGSAKKAKTEPAAE